MAVLEFALAAPVLLLALLGCLYVSLLAFSTSALRYAAAEAARCASVNATICADGAAVQSYASDRYFGLGIPAFALVPDACGNRVRASVTPFPKSQVFNKTVSAVACFPLGG